ncbi:MAG: hypothetical protein ACHQHN_07040 [Sphingobacteriales bacterium]
MDIINMLSVGTIWQNIAFYSFLTLLVCINLELARHGKELKKLKGILYNR